MIRKEELLELLQDDDVKRAIIGIVTSGSISKEAPAREDEERRQAQATGGTGTRTV